MTPLLVNVAEQSANQRPSYQSRYDQRYSQPREPYYRQQSKELSKPTKPFCQNKGQGQERDKPQQTYKKKNRLLYRDYNRDSRGQDFNRRDRNRDFDRCDRNRDFDRRNRDQEPRGKGKKVNQVKEDSKYNLNRLKSSGLTISKRVNFIGKVKRTCPKYKHVFNSIKDRDTHKKKKLCLPPHIL
jgi:hypothetical protein